MVKKQPEKIIVEIPNKTLEFFNIVTKKQWVYCTIMMWWHQQPISERWSPPSTFSFFLSFLLSYFLSSSFSSCLSVCLSLSLYTQTQDSQLSVDLQRWLHLKSDRKRRYYLRNHHLSRSDFILYYASIFMEIVFILAWRSYIVA